MLRHYNSPFLIRQPFLNPILCKKTSSSVSAPISRCRTSALRLGNTKISEQAEAFASETCWTISRYVRGLQSARQDRSANRLSVRFFSILRVNLRMGPTLGPPRAGGGGSTSCDGSPQGGSHLPGEIRARRAVLEIPKCAEDRLKLDCGFAHDRGGRKQYAYQCEEFILHSAAFLS
jgi:hypothetical protein